MNHQGPGTGAAFVALQPTPRRILGDVSPNTRMAATSTPTEKAFSTTPLKRNFSAALNDGAGFTYLKRRNLSSDKNHHAGNLLARNEVNPAEASHVSARLWAIDPQNESLPKPSTVNTPVRSAEDGEDESSSVERRSFSSLINYEPSSQNTTNSHTQPRLLFKGPSYAEILKLRLQMAMYKIKTNQIDIPFDDLRENRAPPLQPNYAEAEEAVAALRAGAQLREIKRSHAHPCAVPVFPAPVLRPTTCSSRFIHGRPMPSSPPATAPVNPKGSITPANSRRQCIPEDELTSSVITGRVAEGLMYLRHNN
ncbi:Putative transcription factor Nrm1/Whi5 [Septoria linicola]|uniref:Transcription factor Nrm1/Whi5 n=1 Tax=Septoria linicola TaxID=215465 RepID=A0A9Q9AJI0_9PEZI|nr:putative transcription factor Nrm1/Whi5 [Septoria linicola]USW47590.1 Putative transcription factor Nrm1/Whi5 [Septoria linicola]